MPPPPKTAIAGPEYFGLTHPEVLQQIEALDPDRLCTDYWDGKEVCNPSFITCFIKRIPHEAHRSNCIDLARASLLLLKPPKISCNCCCPISCRAWVTTGHPLVSTDENDEL